MKKTIILLAMVSLFFVGVSHAAEYCNSFRMVSHGDGYEEVLSKCGNPSGYSIFENRFGVQVGIELKYNLGSGTYPRYIYFNKHGICTRIRIGNERN
jgi:hypothetical protein